MGGRVRSPPAAARKSRAPPASGASAPGSCRRCAAPRPCARACSPAPARNRATAHVQGTVGARHERTAVQASPARRRACARRHTHMRTGRRAMHGVGRPRTCTFLRGAHPAALAAAAARCGPCVASPKPPCGPMLNRRRRPAHRVGRDEVQRARQYARAVHLEYRLEQGCLGVGGWQRVPPGLKGKDRAGKGRARNKARRRAVSAREVAEGQGPPGTKRKHMEREVASAAPRAARGKNLLKN